MSLTSISAATEEAGEFLGPCLINPYQATVWYQFSAPANGTLTAQVIGLISDFSGFFDPHVAVFSGSSISAPIPGECNDDESDTTIDSRVDVPVTAGRTYGIQVGGVPDDEGDFQLLVNFAAAPPPPTPPPPTPPTVVDSRLKKAFSAYGSDRRRKYNHKTEIVKLKLEAEPGSSVQIECKGDCGGIKKAEGSPHTVDDAGLDLKKMFGKNKLLAANTRIELTVTKAGEIGRYFKLVTRGTENLPKFQECRVQASGQLTDCQSG